MPPKKDDPKSRVAAILAAAEKKYDTKIGPLSQIMQDVKSIPTGNISIDAITGIGGIPMGRLTEGYGPPSSGKTTTAIQAAAAVQRIIIAGGDPERGIGPDDKVVYMDYEHAFDPKYCKQLGLDPDHESFLFSQPDSLEDGANLLLELVETGIVRFVIIDSIAWMTPSAKLSAEIGKSLPALQAKLLSDFFAAYIPLAYKHNTATFCVNHIYEVMEMGARRPGMPARTSTPGGRALKFGASLRLEYKQIQNVKTTEVDLLTQEKVQVITSTNVAVKVTKNKNGAPFRQAIVRVRYGKGFDNFWSAIQILIANKLVMYQPGIFKFHRLEKENAAFAPNWMPRMTVGEKPPALKGEKDLFKAATRFPEWADLVIKRAVAVIEEKGIEAFDIDEGEDDLEDDGSAIGEVEEDESED